MFKENLDRRWLNVGSSGMQPLGDCLPSAVTSPGYNHFSARHKHGHPEARSAGCLCGTDSIHITQRLELSQTQTFYTDIVPEFFNLCD